MRIFYYSPFYYPQSNAAAIRAYWIVKTLKTAGHIVSTTSSIDTNESDKLTFNPADNKQSFLKRLIYEVLAGVELFFEILFSSHDLFILSSPPFITVFISHLACRLRNKKYVIDVRDLYPDVYFAQGLINKNSTLGKMVQSFTRGMYERSHGVISVTPGLVQKIKTLAPKTPRVELLMNGFDSDLFKPRSEKYEDFTVVFHGNMGKVQNIPTILKVAEQFQTQNIKFLFIGEGPQSEFLTNSKLSNIQYLGPKDYDEIPKIIAKAHVGFSARRDDEIGADAFPVKAFEYLGVGIPVIMTPKSGIMSKLAPDSLFEFNNDDIDGIVKKILEFKETKFQIKSPRDFSRQEASRKILSFCDFK